MSDRDRNSSYPSYLIESLNNIHHYVNYRFRTYEDLATLQKAVHELNRVINLILITRF